MIEQEVDEIILISSGLATRTDFYAEMKPVKCPKHEYQKALIVSYESLEKYLNETDHKGSGNKPEPGRQGRDKLNKKTIIWRKNRLQF